MSERSDVKITVLRRFSPSEVFETLPATKPRPVGKCERFKDGQEFIIGKDGKIPDDFCISALLSIYKNVEMLSFGGNIPWFTEKNVIITPCPDGLRPVIFKLERI